MESNRVTVGALALLALIVLCATFLVYTDDLQSDLFMGVVVGPIVGGLIGFAAGSKGVQQGSQATLTPPPEA